MKPGAHLNLVGAHSPTTREVVDEAVGRSAIYVDLMQSVLNEAGDLLIPMQSGVIGRERILGEIAVRPLEPSAADKAATQARNAKKNKPPDRSNDFRNVLHGVVSAVYGEGAAEAVDRRD